MQEQFNLDREFIKWFYEEPYPYSGSNRSQVMKGDPQPIQTNISWQDYWMREAFMQGVRTIAKETLCILSDWGAAAGGLDPDFIEPSEIYERAEENLTHYYTKQLELF